MEKYFTDFKKYAFRLELLQKYDVDYEKDEFENFLRTGKIDKNKNDDWDKIIKEAGKRGAVMSRVHIVDLPLSDYLKYEIEAYKFSVKSGENIFLLENGKFSEIDEIINFDYWLFDDKTVLRMIYDSDGKYIGFEKIKKNISEFIKFKDKIISESSRLEDFLKIYGLRLN